MRLSPSIVIVSLLAGCTSAPKIPDAGVRQVRASIPAAEGEIKYTGVAIWLPNSKEFKFKVVEPVVKGVVVLTEKSIVFQQWGGANGLSTLHQIPYAQLRGMHMETIGRSGRLVAESTEGRFDSFAITDGAGEISLRTETEEMFRVLQNLVRR